MRKFSLALCTFVILSYTSFSQFNFSVDPGFGIKGAFIGYQIGNIVPFVGIQFISGSSTVESNYMDYDETTQTYKPVSRTEEVTGSIYMPYAGAKLFFELERSSKLKPYLSAMVFKPFISYEFKDNTDDFISEDEFQENLNIYGVEAGFGTEYFLDDNFSFGGEAGIRMIFGSSNESSTDYYYDGSGNQIEYERKYDYSTLLGISYAKIILNFYY